ncbi:MAG: NAD(P)/FAD-dependent oxidoreductase [Chloroflexi bacterium]|nr:NAD(P)/FAD-dependent oxidoreductase [Chloroflexota bacterium]
MSTAAPRPRVVIVGAGFGGLAALKALARAPADVVLVDRHNYHLFTPLLYQVATAGVEPESIAEPVRRIASGRGRADFRMAEVTSVDLEGRRVVTPEGDIPYDYLILAPGSDTNFFGLKRVAERAHGVKSLSEAVALRNHVLRRFEKAALEPDAARRAAMLTFLVIGGGPTGVEMTGALSELVRVLQRRDYRGIDLGPVRIVLLEAADRLLLPFRPELSEAAAEALRRKGVEVVLGAKVEDAADEGIRLADGTVIVSDTIVWAAGVLGSPLPLVPEVTRSRWGRVPVGPTLQLPGHPSAYVAGDLAYLEDETGAPLPMMAPVAIQQGDAAARNVLRRLAGREPVAFRYRNRGLMATIGRNKAVAQIGFLSLRGLLAWVIWLLVHLVWLIGFRNKLIVLLAWTWDYFLYDRSVRLITED